VEKRLFVHVEKIVSWPYVVESDSKSNDLDYQSLAGDVLLRVMIYLHSDADSGRVEEG
jgi:hypothetical protein